MQSNTSVLELIQNIAGTTDGGTPTLNGGTLPVLFSEYQTAHRISDKCSEIVYSVRDMDGASTLVTAVSGAMQKYDNTLSGLKQKIAKQAAEGFDDADRHAFATLDQNSKDELLSIVVDDPILHETIKIDAAKSQTVQQPSRQ